MKLKRLLTWFDSIDWLGHVVKKTERTKNPIFGEQIDIRYVLVASGKIKFPLDLIHFEFGNPRSFRYLNVLNAWGFEDETGGHLNAFEFCFIGNKKDIKFSLH